MKKKLWYGLACVLVLFIGTPSFAADGDPVLSPVVENDINADNAAAQDDILTYSGGVFHWQSRVELGLMRDSGDTVSGDYNFSGAVITQASPFVFEGVSSNAYETTFNITDPTADRVITFPDSSQTVGTATAIQNDLITEDDLANSDWGDVNITGGVAQVQDLTIASEAAGDILYFNGSNWVRLAKSAGNYLKSGAAAVSWDSPTGSGDITDVGDVSSGAAFTASGTAGTSLYFYDAQGRGQLTIANLTAARTYTLPDSDQTMGVATSITDDLIVKADFANEDWGDVSVSSNTVTLDANVVDSAQYIDASIDYEHLNASVISGMTEVTSTDADYILIWDATDSALKKVDMGEVRTSKPSWGVAVDTQVTVSPTAGVLAVGSNLYIGVYQYGTQATTVTSMTGGSEGDIIIIKRKLGSTYDVTFADTPLNDLDLQADFTLDAVNDMLVLLCTDTNKFIELSRASNG